MVKSVMRIDLMSFRRLAVMALVGLVVLIIALIIGAAGPQSMESFEVSTYNCTDGTHSAPCQGGYSMSDGESFTYELPRAQIYNRFFAIDAFPFLRPGADANVLNEIKLQTNLEYLGGNGWNEVRQEAAVFPFTCLEGTLTCFGFTIVDEPVIEHSTYRVSVTLVPGAGNATKVIGDFAFRFFRQNGAYSALSVAFRAIYGIISLGVIGFAILRFRSVAAGSWTLEQRWILVLLSLLFFMNNPLYFTEIYTQSLFWPVVTAFFESVFVAAFIFFALAYVDALRLGRDYIDYRDKITWLKLALVGVYFILSLALFIWQEAVLARDPIVNRDVTGPTALFFVVSLLYGVLIVWLGVILVFLLPQATGNSRWFTPRTRARRPPRAPEGDAEAAPSNAVPEPEPEDNEPTPSTPATRIAHTLMPLSLVCISTIIGVFAGSFGPFGRTAVGLWYFLTLYNVTVFFWLYGWWPMTSGSAASAFAGTERAPLVPSFPTRDIQESSEFE